MTLRSADETTRKNHLFQCYFIDQNTMWNDRGLNAYLHSGRPATNSVILRPWIYFLGCYMSIGKINNVSAERIDSFRRVRQSRKSKLKTWYVYYQLSKFFVKPKYLNFRISFLKMWHCPPTFRRNLRLHLLGSCRRLKVGLFFFLTFLNTTSCHSLQYTAVTASQLTHFQVSVLCSRPAAML